jgi:magnesium-transporting ATPase (P-type)
MTVHGAMGSSVTGSPHTTVTVLDTGRAAEVLATLDSRPSGLTTDEVEERAGRFGRNTLARPPERHLVRRFLGNFTHVMAIGSLPTPASSSRSACGSTCSMLTGESKPVRKVSDPVLPGADGAGERPNIVFAGTIVVSGRGTAVVYSTGSRTEFGAVASLTEAMTSAGAGPSRQRRAANRTAAM